MNDIKRLTELAGLNELETQPRFAEVSDTASKILSILDDELKSGYSLSEVVEYYARRYGVDPEELEGEVNFYKNNPEAYIQRHSEGVDEGLGSMAVKFGLVKLGQHAIKKLVQGGKKLGNEIQAMYTDSENGLYSDKDGNIVIVDEETNQIIKRIKPWFDVNEELNENLGGFIEGERVRHLEQNRTGTVRGYEGDETAVEFDDEPGEAYFVDNAVLELVDQYSGMEEEFHSFKESNGLPSGYDTWRTYGGEDEDPDERMVDDALARAKDSMSHFIDSYDGDPADLHSELMGVGQNSMEDEIPGYDFKDDIHHLYQELMAEHGIIVQPQESLEEAKQSDLDYAISDLESEGDDALESIAADYGLDPRQLQQAWNEYQSKTNTIDMMNTKADANPYDPNASRKFRPGKDAIIRPDDKVNAFSKQKADLIKKTFPNEDDAKDDRSIDLESAGFMDADEALRLKNLQEMPLGFDDDDDAFGPYGEETMPQIVQQYEQGKSMEDIARQFDCSVDHVYDVLNTMGVQPRQESMTEDEQLQLQRMKDLAGILSEVSGNNRWWEGQTQILAQMYEFNLDDYYEVFEYSRDRGGHKGVVLGPKAIRNGFKQAVSKFEPKFIPWTDKMGGGQHTKIWLDANNDIMAVESATASTTTTANRLLRNDITIEANEPPPLRPTKSFQ